MRRASFVIAACTCALAISALRGQQAQQGDPHAGYAYPAGGRQGTTVELQIGGQFLDGATDVLISGSGVQATVTNVDKPVAGQQLAALRDRAQELQKQPPSPAIQKELSDLRTRIADSVRRTAMPALSERVTLRVDIAPTATPGSRSLRLRTRQGLSNPLVFVVGELPELEEPGDEAVSLPAVFNGRLVPGDGERGRGAPRQAGQFLPGDVDRFHFHARRGQQIVAIVTARELMPYLADAVPGWLQATIAIRDESGRELAYEDDRAFRPDPVAHCVIPADGDYTVEVKDAIYRGRDDFVYRVTVGELPYITSIFPLGGSVRGRTAVQLSGWNLPVTRITTAKMESTGVVPLDVVRDGVHSNRATFEVSDLPETLEREPNNTRKNSMAIALPIIINGRIQQPDDEDVFTFKAHANDRIVAEITARRLGSPLDSVLELDDPSGTRIARNDDFEDKSEGLLTHHADSRLIATIPVDGTYSLRVADVQRHGGNEYAYRLRVSAPRPDFELIVSPSSINAQPGMPVPIVADAVRRDGFDGDIDVALDGAPAAYRLTGAVIPAGQTHVKFTLTAAAGSAEVVDLAFVGRGVIDGKTVTHRALPADDMMQAFAYHHLVPADATRAAAGRGGVRAPLRITTPMPLKLAIGQTTRVDIALPPALAAFEHLQFDLADPVEGVTLQDATQRPNGASFVVRVDAAKTPAAARGNLIVTISGERVPPAAPNQPQPPRRRVVIGTLPAIPYEFKR